MGNENFKILIAEDEEINYLYIEILIKKEYPQLKILHAKNGIEAVNYFENEDKIALVLMDIKMPVMNGYEATTKIKKINKNIPVIALTAYCSEDDKKQAQTYGFTDFLTKPINKKQFLSLLKQNIALLN